MTFRPHAHTQNAPGPALTPSSRNTKEPATSSPSPTNQWTPMRSASTIRASWRSSPQTAPSRYLDRPYYISSLTVLLSMAESQLRSLREKLQAQEVEFQNYRDQCKNLQNFLEAENTKKETEIRKLKEQAITKEKLFKALKQENASLVAQISALKAETAKYGSVAGKCEDLEQKYRVMEAACKEKELEKAALVQQLDILKLDCQANSAEINEKFKKIAQLEETLAQNENKINQLQGRLQQNLSVLQEQRLLIEELQSKKSKGSELTQREKLERVTTSKKTVKKEDSKAQEIDPQRIRKYQQKLQRYERQIRELKQKLAQKKSASPSKLNSPLIISPEKEEDQQSFSKVFIGCYVVTKPYYISPIAELNQQSKCVKLYKNSRNGCFQKSLGSSRHKFDMITHESAAIVKQIVDRISKFQEDFNHSILIYGVKRSNKKQVMAAVLTKLFNLIRNKVEGSEDLEAIYIRNTAEEEGGLVKETAYSVDEVLNLLEKMTNISQIDKKLQKPQKPQKPQKGKKQRPRIHYFSIRAGDFSLQISTSSYTAIPYRQKQVITTFYNNVLYSKLPDILQSSYSQRYIIVTLNPIVDLYQDCKNTLNVTQYRISAQDKDRGLFADGANKELFSQMARRRLEIYEKEIDQTLLRLRKVEEEANYYRTRFDQLECRLKTLLSTHHAQSSYLKKSPILLSYEKLLKFVHAVQSRGTPEQPSSTQRLPADFELEQKLCSSFMSSDDVL